MPQRDLLLFLLDFYAWQGYNNQILYNKRNVYFSYAESSFDRIWLAFFV